MGAASAFVAEVGQETAGLGREGGFLPRRHLDPPAADARWIGRGRRAPLLSQALFAADDDLAIDAEAFAVFDEPARSMKMEIQHRSIPGKIEEATDAPQLDFGFPNQILVAEFHVSRTPDAIATRLGDPVSPVPCERRNVARRREPEWPERQCGVAPVPDDVDHGNLG